MPLNIPTGSNNNISFGPARILMDPWSSAVGSTPTTDVGFIGEDGLTIELSSEKKDITQGNPQLIQYSFVTAQSATINVTSIEWNFENFRLALGAGATSIGNVAKPPSGGAATTVATFNFGGNPLNTYVALQVQHRMAQSAGTLYAYIWKAQSESGFSLPFGTDEHTFEFSFKALAATKNWNGVTLPFDQCLMKLEREYSRTQILT